MNKKLVSKNLLQLDIEKYPFPELDDTMMAFSVLKTDPKLLEEAKARGYGEFNGANSDCAAALRLFDKIFFEGAKVVYKVDIEAKPWRNIRRYMVALMKSWEPKHEHKRAVCAMLLAEICDVEKSLK